MKQLMIFLVGLLAGHASLQAQTAVRMQVGDIYYADGTTSRAEVGSINAKYKANPTDKPIGVVYYVEVYGDGAAGRRGWVIALKDAYDGNYCGWGDMDTDESGLPNYASRRGPKGDGNEALADTAGQAHTQWMNGNHTLSSSNYPAFCHAYRYNDGSTAVGGGRWYLPAAGQLCRLYGVMESLAASFDALNRSNYGSTTATKMSTGLYWSSSEHSALSAWDVPASGKLDNPSNKGFNGYVRSSCSF